MVGRSILRATLVVLLTIELIDISKGGTQETKGSKLTKVSELNLPIGSDHSKWRMDRGTKEKNMKKRKTKRQLKRKSKLKKEITRNTKKKLRKEKRKSRKNRKKSGRVKKKAVKKGNRKPNKKKIRKIKKKRRKDNKKSNKNGKKTRRKKKKRKQNKEKRKKISLRQSKLNINEYKTKMNIYKTSIALFKNTAILERQCNLMGKKADKASYVFKKTLDALKLNSANGPGRQSVGEIAKRMNITAILSNCPETAKKICDKFTVESCQNQDLIDTCKKELRRHISLIENNCLKETINENCDSINNISRIDDCEKLVGAANMDETLERKQECISPNVTGSFVFCKRQLVQVAETPHPTRKPCPTAEGESVLTFIQNNRTVKQRNTFDIDTGILTMDVPSHTAILNQSFNQATLMFHAATNRAIIKSGHTCVLSDIPDYINATGIPEYFEQLNENSSLFDNDNKEIAYEMKMITSIVGSKERKALMPTMDSLCYNEKIEMAENKLITLDNYKNLVNGGIVTLNNPSRDQRSSCLISTSCTKRDPDSCGNSGWYNPTLHRYISMHRVSIGGTCLSCCINDESCDCKIQLPNMCPCEKILDKEDIMDCLLLGDYNFTFEECDGSVGTQYLSYNSKYDRRSVKIYVPSQGDVEDTGNIREGTYENHLYDGTSTKNDWHYVEIERSGDNYKWSNKAGVSWTLYPTDDPNTLRVGEDSPYYAGYDHRTALFDDLGVYGPFNEFYKFKVDTDSGTCSTCEETTIVWHANHDGYWQEDSNNMMMKLGSTCYISTIPKDVFPVHIASGIKNISDGNFMIKKNNENQKYIVLLEEQILNSNEKENLHPQIKEICKDNELVKYEEFEVMKEDFQKINEGKTIVLKNNEQSDGCKLQRSVISKINGVGCWRWPITADGGKTMMHALIKPVTQVSACCDDTSSQTPDCCETSIFSKYCNCPFDDRTTIDQCKVCAVLYEDLGYNGSSFRLYTNKPISNLRDIGWNDKISSVRIMDGSILYAYHNESFQGIKLEITSNTYRFCLDDNISSLRCSELGSATKTRTTTTKITDPLIVLIGGYYGNDVRTSSEVISPTGVCNHTIPPLPFAAYDMAAVYFDNQIMLCGGHTITNTLLKSCHFLRNSASHWEEGPEMNLERQNFELVKARDAVFALGGRSLQGSGGPAEISIEKYCGGKWTLLKEMPTGRQQSCAVYWEAIDSLVVIGGFGADDKVEAFNIQSEQWSDLASLPYGLRLHNCALLNETIYVIGGGVHSGANGARTVLKYTKGAKAWEESEPVNSYREYHSANVLDGKLLIASAYRIGDKKKQIERMKDDETWEYVPSALLEQRDLHAAVEVPEESFPCL